MSILKKFTFVLLFSALGFSSFSQVGVRADVLSILNGNRVTRIFVPIMMNNLKLEPVLGLNAGSGDIRDDADVGFGIFGLMTYTNEMRSLFGGRLILGNRDDDFFNEITGCAGGEYILNDHFGIGAEAELRLWTDFDDVRFTTYFPVYIAWYF